MIGNSAENVLYVKMFGGFSLSWNGRLITGSSKSSESQFNQLMQQVLHMRGRGVNRDQLERILFEDRDIINVHHSMRNVVYNAKRKLKSAGLPDVNYIILKDGLYYWTDEIPVIEDASEFDRLYKEAEEEQDKERKAELYLEACHKYSGEFLAAWTSVVWVAQEGRRYRSIFCECVERAVELLREQQDYLRMEELGIYAAKIHPMANWETVTMEAMMSMGRYDEARKLYDDTVEMYFQKEGIRPSGRMKELLDKMGAQMEYHYAVLDDIQTKFLEDEERQPGGYMCSYPVFQGVYRMIKRMMERGGQAVYLMLCTVVDSKGNPMKEGPILDELSQRLCDAIRKSVRYSDAINKYGKGQYLILLVNTTRENCNLIQKRINYHFLVGRQRTGIQYYVNSVVCSPDEKKGIIDRKRRNE